MYLIRHLICLKGILWTDIQLQQTPPSVPIATLFPVLLPAYLFCCDGPLQIKEISDGIPYSSFRPLFKYGSISVVKTKTAPVLLQINT